MLPQFSIAASSVFSTPYTKAIYGGVRGRPFPEKLRESKSAVTAWNDLPS
jgi:hypothetical protein